MKIRFQVHYPMEPGQRLLVSGSLPALGNGQVEDSLPMLPGEGGEGGWILTVETGTAVDFTYRYFIRDDSSKTWIGEFGPDRHFSAGGRKGEFVLDDRWRSPADPAFALHTSAFLKAILKNEPGHPASRATGTRKEGEVVLAFQPSVVRIKPGHRVAVCGSSESLGAWNESRALVLGNPDHPNWSGEAATRADEFPVRYKYLIQDETGKTLFWEKCSDRVAHLPGGSLPDVMAINDEQFDFPQYPWKGAGVAVPVFSLRRANGHGVGEFTDLRLMVDWAVQTGIRMIQILPVNDTVARHTWHDSYPYAAISVYALHPIYINLSEMGKLNSEVNRQIIEEQGRYLNTLPKVDYEAVMSLKSRYFKLLFDQNREEFLPDPAFRAFFQENEHWLRPYAAFSYLRDLYNTSDFSRWGAYRTFSPEVLKRLTDEKSDHFDEIAVHYFIQFHAWRQLLDAAAYARSKGVVLKGDIPIGIFRNSVDAWVAPELYHMDRQAGAPPDDFSAKGQNWRFPTYNWEAMAADGYSWWKKRLHQLSDAFDAFRIDHILGFFRIWEIPASQTEGLMGYFNPSIPYTREEFGMRGLHFDEERLCKPYIREHFLYERFGDLADWVRQHYLDEYSPGCFRIRPDFDTQAKVAERLTPEPDAGQEARSRAERIIQGMNSLIGEVVFLPAPDTGENGFFPRNALHFTRSYQELDENSRRVIDGIYLDYFYRRNEEFWRERAMEKLPAIRYATDMLVCGEDLGMVPACVPSVMSGLGILSLEVQRMPKDPKIAFGRPAEYPYLSVATPSSHDTSTIRGWWEEDPGRSARFYREYLGQHGQAPFECTTGILRQIILQHLYSPSMWAIFPIQDLLGMEERLRYPDPQAERINNPGNPDNYWRYRMHLNIEDLQRENDFNRMLRDLFRESGRLEAY
jgi:4-alpha-glucanotransferase